MASKSNGSRQGPRADVIERIEAAKSAKKAAQAAADAASPKHAGEPTSTGAASTTPAVPKKTS